MMQGSLEDITKAVGNTPIVRLNKVARDVPVEIYVKCEYLNPGGSHKDRLAANILKRAEEGGSSRAGPSSRPRAATPAPRSRSSRRCAATSASS